jgi:parallel beta-helix repeat protein
MLLFPAGYQFCDINGDPVASGTVTFYATGTTSYQTIYSDPDLTIQAANPISLDAAGRFASSINVYGTGTYTVLVKDATAATVFSRDDVFGWGDGTPYYRRSDEEISAGVIPSDYQRIPGDIRRYGALVDGSADDTDAWTAAVSIGINIYTPAGTTRVDPDVINLKSGVRLYGDGWSSIIKPNSAGKIIKNENWNTTTRNTDICIEDLCVDSTGYTGSAIPTIQLKYVKYGKVRNVKVIEPASQGILIAGYYTGGVHYPSEYCKVENCLIDGSKGTGVTFFGETKYCTSIGNTVVNHKDDAFAFDAEASTACYGNKSIGDTSYNGTENDPAAGGRGIEIGGQLGFVCTGFSTRNLASSGIVLEYGTGGSTACSDVTITGFTIIGAGTLDSDADSIGYGINIGRCDGLTLSSGRVTGSQDHGVHVATTATKVSIDNVTAASNGGCGFNVTGPGTLVTNCDAYSNQQHGIFINDADYCEVLGNTCFSNGINTGAEYDGIKAQNSDYIQVNNNHCYDVGGSPTQNNGVFLTNCDRADMSWNLAHGNATEQILPQNFGPSTDCDYITMRGNILDPGASLKGTATIANGQSNVTVTNANVTLGSVISIIPTNATMAAAVAAANGMHVTKLNKTSFTVTVTTALGADGTFDWMIT